MQRKLILILSSLLILFSFDGFSQTTPAQSVHPKMDKYYPRPQKTQVLDNNADTSSVIPAPARPVTQTSPAPVMTTSPPSNNTVVNQAPAVTPTTPATVEPQIQTGPAVTSTPVTVAPSNTTVTNSNTVTAPAAVTVNKHVQPKQVSQTSSYVDPSSLFTTRLGSSAPQYDTWQKNNDGAGSVSSQSK